MLSTVPVAVLFTSVFIMPNTPLLRAMGSSFAIASPTFFSISAGRSRGWHASRLATFSGVTSPSRKVCATTVPPCTRSPSATRTSPWVGSARRTRSTLCAETFRPGV